MLEFAKNILEKVSFDGDLFQKELIKALKKLSSNEALALYSWCLITFGGRYREIIIRVFTDSKII